MLPENHKTSIIANGLHFMRSITEAYGAEKGMELWDQISNVLDPEVKGQIFFAMITGNYNDKIVLKGVRNTGIQNAVACIKELRSWTGYGLKESKDMYDRLRDKSQMGLTANEDIKIHHEDYNKAVTGLRSVGFII